MRADAMERAENKRRAKVQRLINILCLRDKGILDDIIACGFNENFDVGRNITVRGENIIIRNRNFRYSELQRIVINTEGSMAIYAQNGRRLCGMMDINLSVKNIELFCVWARKYNIFAEAVSGKNEKIFQWLIFAAAVSVSLWIKLIRYF